ncbi:MAG: helix-turn-helix domain-containing protein [Patescibacteria group bacterium]|nr:helix-turn-helix domain-containing protein [Patescibacteria group bacterium]
MSIQITLKKLGLDEKEIRVYLNLLKNGRTKPSLLAKITKINRPTLYNVARELISKGIVAEDLSGKSMSLIPLPIENLEKVLEQEKRELKEKEELVKNAINELSLVTANKEYPVPKIRFIEEENLERYLYDNLVKWQKEVIASDGVWWGYQDHAFAVKFEKWLDHTWETKQSRDPNYKGWIFSNESKIEQKLGHKYPKDKRRVRFLEGTNFTASTWISGDYMVMISTYQHPYYLIEIHDKLLAHNTREIFRKLWERTGKKI